MDRKVVGTLLVLVSAATFLMVVHSTKHEAHMLLLNGRVYTLGADLPVAQSIAIRGNTIVAVGSSEDLRRQFAADTVIDLEGKTVMPGFIDAHAHMEGLGQLLQSVILVGARSAAEA